MSDGKALLERGKTVCSETTIFDSRGFDAVYERDVSWIQKIPLDAFQRSIRLHWPTYKHGSLYSVPHFDTLPSPRHQPKSYLLHISPNPDTDYLTATDTHKSPQNDYVVNRTGSSEHIDRTVHVLRVHFQQVDRKTEAYSNTEYSTRRVVSCRLSPQLSRHNSIRVSLQATITSWHWIRSDLIIIGLNSTKSNPDQINSTQLTST